MTFRTPRLTFSRMPHMYVRNNIRLRPDLIRGAGDIMTGFKPFAILTIAGALTMAARPVLAGTPFVPVLVSITATVTPVQGGFDWDYTVTNQTHDTAPTGSITSILIPELHAGDLVAQSAGTTCAASLTGVTTAATCASSAFAFPLGWTAAETTVSPLNLPVPGLYGAGTPGAFITITTANFLSLTPGSALDFNFFSALGGPGINAQIVVGSVGDGTAIADPPIPNSAPEPASLGLFGTAVGLLALRRRKRG